MADGLNEPLVTTVRPEPEAGTLRSSFLQQVQLLTFKNLLITFKNPKNIIFLVLTPFLLSLFLFGFQHLAEDNGNFTIPDPGSSPMPAFPKCGWEGCVSLDVRLASNSSTATINDYQWIRSVVNTVESKTGIKPHISSTVITQYAGVTSYYDQLQAEANKTQIGVIMCGYQNFPTDDPLSGFCNTPTDYAYYLVLNKLNTMGTVFHALSEAFPLDLTAAALKNAIDNAVLSYSATKEGVDQATIEYETSRFPLGPNRYLKDYDIVTAIGAFYYMITPLFAFLFIQSEIVREKQYRLRQGLNIFGASHTSYWISWFIISLLYSLIVALSTFFAGFAFGFGFFRQTPFYIIIFFLLFPLTLALSMLAFLIATLAPTLNAANASSYAIVLLAIVVQSFTSDNNVLTLIFTTQTSALVDILKIFLTLYPPFSYTKIFTNITQYSGHHFDFNQRAWIPGQKSYNMDLFTSATSGRLPFGDGTFDRYSDLISMLILFGDAVLFAILAWYFDNVISSNRGRSEPLLFPIFRFLKLFGWKKDKKKIISLSIKSKPLGEEEESAINQRNRVYQNSQKNIPALGLRIKALAKTFTSGVCFRTQLRALDQLNIEIEPNQLMAVLGHNGAGKTTLINILTGVLSPDEDQDTQIIINRESIANIDEIRKFIGLCAQFDILWEELTAEQHLRLFARLKGIPEQQIEGKIKELLKMVNLQREGKNAAKGFSGGMKRRLSLAISAIGDPKIILLDEPTTGLDPKVRQQVWGLVEKLKKNRSIILTTHSMQEADILGDRVCVMVKGRLKCIGSPLYLKQQYGLGHRLTLNIDRKQVDSIMGNLRKVCPSAVMVDYKGGNLVVGVDDFQTLLKLIKVLQSQDSHGLEQHALKSAIRDWNVSHATLQQVFMQVSKQKQAE